MKKPEIGKLDNLWALKIKQRAGFICESCGASQLTTKLESAHIVGRANRTLRWDLNNGMCLCFSCHQGYDQHFPIAYQIREKVIGKERLEFLLEKRQIIAKDQDYEEIRKGLQEAKFNLY